jgi:hypothetical protein
LHDVLQAGAPAVRISYFGPGGELLATRFRIALTGDRLRWKAGSKPQLYGLNHLDEARQAGEVVIVEGESDVHTFWHHGIAALGVPGAANWREERDAKHLDRIDKIYVVIEPDHGGETMKKWIAQSAIRHRVRLVTLPHKTQELETISERIRSETTCRRATDSRRRSSSAKGRPGCL